MVKNKFQLLCLTLAFICLVNIDSANGFDTSDTKPPVVTYRLIQDLPSRGNLVVFEVTVTDEKNDFYVPVGRSFPAVLYTFDPSKLAVDLAPICKYGGQIDFATQLIARQAKSVKLPDGKYQAVFDLFMYMVKPGDMPSGCPDWRQGSGFIYSNFPFVRDAAGNEASILPSSTARRDDFSYSPIAPIIDRLNLAESKHYCFIVPYGDWEQDYLQRLLTAYKDGIKPHIGKSYAKDIIAEFDKKFPRFEIVAQQYLMTGKNPLSLEQINKLELCQWFARPWTEDLQVTFMDTSRALTSASAASTPTKTKKLTCVKGKSTLVVAGSNPKCPQGYKKK